MYVFGYFSHKKLSVEICIESIRASDLNKVASNHKIDWCLKFIHYPGSIYPVLDYCHPITETEPRKNK